MINILIGHYFIMNIAGIEKESLVFAKSVQANKMFGCELFLKSNERHILVLI